MYRRNIDLQKIAISQADADSNKFKDELNRHLLNLKS